MYKPFANDFFLKALAAVSFLVASIYLYGNVIYPWLQSRQVTAKNVETTLPSVATANESLEVATPKPYQEITSPVLVSGKSNFYETVTSIRIKDSGGSILAETTATASGWTDKLYPFSKMVNYPKSVVSYARPVSGSAHPTGVVEVYEVSPKDGSEVDKIVIPVVFKDL